MSEKYEGNVITIDNLNKSKAEIIPKSNAEQETREGYNYYDKRLAIVHPNTPQNIETTPFPIKKNTTYTFYANGKNWLEVRFYNENDNIIGQIRNGPSSIIMTFTTPENTKTIELIFYAKPNLDLSTYDFTNVMLLEGTYTVDTLPPYEPYGASPSPEFPSPVKTVGQNVNLFDKDNANILNGYVINGQEVISADANGRTLYIPCDANTDYTISKLASRLNVGYSVDIPTLSGTVCNVVNVGKTATKTTYKTGDDAKYLVVFYHSMAVTSPTEQEVLDSIKIEKGTVVTPYSPYGQGSVEIEVCNKNLFDKNNINKLVGYVDGNGNFNIGDSNIRTLYISCMANTDYVVSKFSGQYFRIASFSEEIKNNVHMINGITNKPTASKLSINTGDNAKYLAVTYYNSSKDTLTEQEILNSIQIELGSEATDYIPHESYTKVLPLQKEFVKIGTEDNIGIIEDKFIKMNKVWYEEHNILKKVFNGTENWAFASESSRPFRLFPADGINFIKNQDFGPSVICNKFTSIPWALVNSDLKYGVTSYKDANTLSSKNLCFINKNISTLKEWKELLAQWYENGEPLILYYPLAIPELIPCTPEQSNILDQLENTELYDGINHITAFSSIEPMLEVTVKEPIEDYKTYISSEGYLINNEYNIKFLIDFNESNLPSMPEATESSIRAAGRNGDIVLATTYEPMTFDIVCYTEDNLTQAEKTIEEKKINKFLNSIKNKTITLAFENDRKFYNVKYSGALVTTNFPKHLKFSIPLKSSESYGKDLIEKSIVGNDTGESDTIENAGALITINGPAIKPIISLNDYSIEYDMDILEGAKIEIDSSKSTITHINSDGIKTNVMKYYNHQFPKIENGTNQLKILSGISNANNVMVKWNDLKL